jgi:hypothetical protein
MRAPLLAVCALLFATEAHAQNIDGAFRVALEADPLALQSTTLSVDSSSTSASHTTVGLPGAAAGVAFGYGASNNVVVGARLLASFSSTKVGDASGETNGFSLFPEVEYLFPGAVVRPFVSANVGYSGARTSSGGVDTSSSTFSVGPGVGLHGFASSSLSLDAGLLALYETGTSKSGDAEVAVNGYSVLLTFAVSGWLGGAPVSSAPPAQPAAVEKARASEPTVTVLEETGQIEAAFVLDWPNTAGSVRVALQGNPDLDTTRARLVVSFLMPAEHETACGGVAFETKEARIELSDVKSARGGFGSTLTTQGGSLPFDALRSLAGDEQDVWLVVCGERLPVALAAKRRVLRFVHAFRKRISAEG